MNQLSRMASRVSRAGIRGFRLPPALAEAQRRFATKEAIEADAIRTAWVRELFAASRRGDQQAVEDIFPKIGSSSLGVGLPAFRIACRCGHLHVAQKLAERLHLSELHVWSEGHRALKLAIAGHHSAVSDWLIRTYYH